MKTELLQSAAKIASKSKLLKRVGTKLAVHLLPEEVETRVGNSRFVFRPKIDGLWYLNFSDAEPGVDRVLRENLKEGDTFIDIGAHIGYYSILARNIVGESGKVIAFEPNPESYKLLKKNFEMNEYTNCIAENIALSDEIGFVKLFIGKYRDDSSSLFLVENVDKNRYVTVKTMTFDKYCEMYKISPNFIKIDAEGAEYRILRGITKVIDIHKPNLLIEIHPKHLESQEISIRSLFDFLMKKGYKIQLVREGGCDAISVDELVNHCRLGRKNKFGTMINQVILCKER